LKPFQRTKLDLPPVKEFIKQSMAEFGCSRAEAKRQYNRLKDDEVFINDKYQVNIDRNPPNKIHDHLVHLSIKRRDKEVIHDWRELQQIKTMLCGADCEGLELYPRESRVVDSANQFHLWVLPPGLTIPVGYFTGTGRVGTSPEGGKQRPFDEEIENEHE
jgi:hypothetical protein